MKVSTACPHPKTKNIYINAHKGRKRVRGGGMAGDHSMQRGRGHGLSLLFPPSFSLDNCTTMIHYYHHYYYYHCHTYHYWVVVVDGGV